VDLASLRADVDHLITAQEAYLREHGHYAESMADLRARFPEQRYSGHVDVRGDKKGFMVTAWNDELAPGLSRCTCYGGPMAFEAGVQPWKVLAT
jgi:hypothetical protein